MADAVSADIRVMTVHQAKGLEFEIVVLPELDVELLGQPPALVAHRPDVTGPPERICRYAAEAVQRLLPAAWQRTFADVTDAAVSESLSVLYVALTRAVRAWYAIIAPSKPKERTLLRTFAGLLRAALSDGQPAAPETVLYEHGQRRWFDAPTDGAPPQPTKSAAGPARPGPGEPGYCQAAEAVPVALAVRLAPADGPRRRGWERTRPSGLEGTATVRLEQVLQGGHAAARWRGRLWHAWFAQVSWLEDGLPDETKLRRAAAELLADVPGGPRDLAADLADFHAALRRPAVAELLTRDRYRDLRHLSLPAKVQRDLAGSAFTLRVQNERAFAVRDGQQLLTGYIDRLVLLEGKAEVVAAEIMDYKTDAIEARQTDRLAERVKYYEPQMTAYRRAVAQLFGLDPRRIAATLVFIEAGVALEAV